MNIILPILVAIFVFVSMKTGVAIVCKEAKAKNYQLEQCEE